MNYKFTDRYRMVLARAREEAIRLSHDHVAPVHLALGLLVEGEGIAAALLQNLRIDSGQLLRRINDAAPSGTAGIAIGDLPLLPDAKKVLQLSMAEARELGTDYVGTEHLLLALLHEVIGVSDVFQAFGLTLERGRLEARRILSTEVDLGEHSVARDPEDATAVLASLRDLKKRVAHLQPDSSSLVVLADLDAAPPELLVELMAAMDALHRAWGGTGLVIDNDTVGIAPAVKEAFA